MKLVDKVAEALKQADISGDPPADEHYRELAQVVLDIVKLHLLDHIEKQPVLANAIVGQRMSAAEKRWEDWGSDDVCQTPLERLTAQIGTYVRTRFLRQKNTPPETR